MQSFPDASWLCHDTFGLESRIDAVSEGLADGCGQLYLSAWAGICRRPLSLATEGVEDPLGHFAIESKVSFL